MPKYKLTETDKQVIRYAMEGYTPSQIAKIMGISPNTARKSLWKAKKLGLIKLDPVTRVKHLSAEIIKYLGEIRYLAYKSDDKELVFKTRQLENTIYALSNAIDELISTLLVAKRIFSKNT